MCVFHIYHLPNSVVSHSFYPGFYRSFLDLCWSWISLVHPFSLLRSLFYLLHVFTPYSKMRFPTCYIHMCIFLVRFSFLALIYRLVFALWLISILFLISSLSLLFCVIWIPKYLYAWHVLLAWSLYFIIVNSSLDSPSHTQIFYFFLTLLIVPSFRFWFFMSYIVSLCYLVLSVLGHR